MVTKLSSTSTAGSLTHSPALAHVRDAGLVLAGTLALTLIGQIVIPLPFTPVPISMGTFAALGVGAVLGSRRGALSAMLLGALAAVGAPVLAGWTGGTVVTFGYVIGYTLIAAIAGRPPPCGRATPAPQPHGSPPASPLCCWPRPRSTSRASSG